MCLKSDSCFVSYLPLYLLSAKVMHICISIYISIILSVFIQESVFNTSTNKACTEEFFFYYLPVYLLSARAMHIFCNDPLLPQGLSLTPRTLDICVIVFLLLFVQGVFRHARVSSTYPSKSVRRSVGDTFEFPFYQRL